MQRANMLLNVLQALKVLISLVLTPGSGLNFFNISAGEAYTTSLLPVIVVADGPGTVRNLFEWLFRGV